MKVNWDDDSQYMGKYKMFQTTNQCKYISLYGYTDHNRENTLGMIQKVIINMGIIIYNHLSTSAGRINPMLDSEPITCLVKPVNSSTTPIF